MFTSHGENIVSLKKHVSDALTFLDQYKWITDAYVSDFFVQRHWEKLPLSWREALSAMSPPELAVFLHTGEHETSRVLPLSLLSFRACTQHLSADRVPGAGNDLEHIQKSFKRSQGSGTDPGTSPASSQTNQTPSLSPVGDDGLLHCFFSKHVKPKKQHEILQLGKVVNLLSSYCSCEHVVDVGAGLGHLARLLSFGFGLKVTSVEASDGHAPKANKYDREVEREVQKKKKKAETSPDTGSTSGPALPSHVTCRIYPDTTAEDFLAIIREQSYYDDDAVLSTNHVVNSGTHPSNKAGTESCDCIHENVIFEENLSEHQKPESRTGQHHCEAFDKDRNFSGQPDSTCDNSESRRGGNQPLHPGSNDRHSTSDMLETGQSMKCDVATEEPPKLIALPEPVRKSPSRKRCKRCSPAQWKFVLIGLHACGDLTPTFLRFFVNCQSARALASVGCCYMKLSSDCKEPERPDAASGMDTDMVGYPMSQFVASLGDHTLLYAARELACHFADTYYSRLKDNPPHLKVHCYRAVLEWLCNKISPGFARVSVQIPTKKSNQLNFDSYASLGLKKVGLSSDLLTAELRAAADDMLQQWKDVVAFYTLRLSLAPVIETVLLLDRMIYLHEQGLCSTLAPVFDPRISPRNFALLAWK